MTEESTPVEPNEEVISSLDLQDDEFLKLDEQEYLAQYESTGEGDEESAPVEPEEQEDTDEEETKEEESDSEDAEEENKDNEEEKVDYEAQVKQLLSPFKANGKEIQVDSIDDAMNLMKMGANYNKKMAALKPSLKILKTLENNGLLDETKLNYLIDLEKKNPEAIKRLIQESKFDLDEYDPEDTVEYSPSDHAASEQQVELDTVLEKIQDTPSYQRTVDVITKQMDAASKKELAESPQLIETINSHIELGVYDPVMAQVAKEQALGGLTNLSDFKAYTQVGTRMFENGQLADIVSPNNQSQKPSPKQTTSQPAKPDAKEAERISRKLATKPAKTTKPKTEDKFNPLSMSDAEFEKIALSKYI